MEITINCSLGELLDKISILKIKKTHSIDEIKSKNIKKELSLLEKKIPDHVNDMYLLKLKEINQKLWDLEDSIRLLSKKKQFDKTYIECSEAIHVTNDQRYSVKNEINKMYQSSIVEEKIYAIKELPELPELPESPEITQNDYEILRKAQRYYHGGYIQYCEVILNYLLKKTDNHPLNEYMTELYVSQYVLTSHTGKEYVYCDKLEKIGEAPEKYIISNIKLHYFNKMYSLYLFNKGYYNSKYSRYFNEIHYNKLDISPETISFFSENTNTTHETLLIYGGGGMGDIIMFGRFVGYICERYPQHQIILCIQKKLCWIFKALFKKYSNIIIEDFNKFTPTKIDHHTNLVMIPCYLGVERMIQIKDYESKYLKNMDTCKLNSLYADILDSEKPNIVINWRGSNKSIGICKNRGICLTKLEPLLTHFKNKINWISVQKEVSNEEKYFLRKYNVIDLSETIDTGDQAFYDTIQIFKKIDLVISTDTSILHLAGSMGIHCVGLITKTCEWRWNSFQSDKNITPWYPDMNLIKQSECDIWTDVIKKTIQYINTIYFENQSTLTGDTMHEN